MTSVEERKAQLEGRLEELTSRIRRIEEERDQVTTADVVGTVDEPNNDDVLEDLEESGLREIRMIRAALDRVRQGSYGVCTRCGDDIAEERLDILPATPLCRDCAGA